MAVKSSIPTGSYTKVDAILVSILSDGSGVTVTYLQTSRRCRLCDHFSQIRDPTPTQNLKTLNAVCMSGGERNAG